MRQNLVCNSCEQLNIEGSGGKNQRKPTLGGNCVQYPFCAGFYERFFDDPVVAQAALIKSLRPGRLRPERFDRPPFHLL